MPENPSPDDDARQPESAPQKRAADMLPPFDHRAFREGPEIGKAALEFFERLRSSGKEVMGATLAVDRSGLIRMWSRDAEALLGYSEAEAVGQSIELIIPSHLRGRHHAGFSRYVQTGVSHLPEVAISPAVHKTGVIMKVQISVQAVYKGDEIVAVEARMSPLGAD